VAVAAGCVGDAGTSRSSVGSGGSAGAWALTAAVHDETIATSSKLS
jgi:hypothetical protein